MNLRPRMSSAARPQDSVPSAPQTIAPDTSSSLRPEEGTRPRCHPLRRSRRRSRSRRSSETWVPPFGLGITGLGFGACGLELRIWGSGYLEIGTVSGLRWTGRHSTLDLLMVSIDYDGNIAATLY
ncbi:hypothetical protein BDV19DRAFT_62982 [Aspergillus venezuelensis]